jgi:hypothetical protein
VLGAAYSSAKVPGGYLSSGCCLMNDSRLIKEIKVICLSSSFFFKMNTYYSTTQ